MDLFSLLKDTGNVGWAKLPKFKNAAASGIGHHPLVSSLVTSRVTTTVHYNFILNYNIINQTIMWLIIEKNKSERLRYNNTGGNISKNDNK